MESRQGSFLTPLLRWFLSAGFLAGLSGRMYGFLLPLYLTQLGADVAQVGLVFTTSSVVPLVLPIFGGWISDSIGRLRAIAIGSLGGVLGLATMVLAPSWEWMILALSLSGFASALVDPSTFAFISEQTAEENRGKVYSILASVTQILNVIAYPLGGFLAGGISFRFMLLIAGILQAIATVLYLGLAITVRHTTEAAPLRLTLPSLRKNLGVVIGMIFAGGLFTWLFVIDHINDIFTYVSESYGPLYMQEIGGLTIQQISWIPPIGGIIGMIFTVPLGYLSDKYGESVNMTLAAISFSISKFILIVARSFPAYALCAVAHGMAQAFGGPAYPSLVSKAVPEEKRGIAFGLTSTSRALLSLPSPWIGGQLWERSSPATPFVVTAVAYMGLSMLAWFKLRLPRSGREKSAAV